MRLPISVKYLYQKTKIEKLKTHFSLLHNTPIACLNISKFRFNANFSTTQTNSSLKCLEAVQDQEVQFGAVAIDFALIVEEFGLRAVGMGLGANGAPLTDVASVISSINPAHQQPGMNGTAGAPINPFQSPPNVNPFGPVSNVPVAVPQPIQSVPVAPPSGFQQSTPDHGMGAHFQATPQSAYQPQATGGFFNPPQPTRQDRPSSSIHFGGGGGTSQYAPPKQMNIVGGGAGAAVFGQPTQQQQQTPKFEHKVEPKYDIGAFAGYASGAAQPMSGGGSDNYQASRIILIKNLPVDYTWQIVSDRVQQFGDLESVEMITPGVAKVRFVKLRDAEHAKAALQGSTVEGRAIGIEYL